MGDLITSQEVELAISYLNAGYSEDMTADALCVNDGVRPMKKAPNIVAMAVAQREAQQTAAVAVLEPVAQPEETPEPDIFDQIETEAATSPAPMRVKDSFLTITERAASRGLLRVLPGKVGGKAPLISWAENDKNKEKGVDTRIDTFSTEEWAKVAPAWREQLAAKYPDANAFCVAKPYEFLFTDEDDSDAFRKGYEAYSGKSFPRSYATTSSGPNRRQGYWKQTAATRMLGNVTQGDTLNGMLSVRQRNEYVLCEGSQHPKGAIYTVWDDSPIVEMPDDLVAYIWSIRKTKQTEFKKKPEGWLDASFTHHDIDNQLIAFAGHYISAKNISDPGELYSLLIFRLEKNGCFERDGVTPFLYNEKRVREIAEDKVKTWKTGDQIKAESAVALGSSRESVSVIEPEVSYALETMPASALASTRLADIYAEVFEPHGWPLDLAMPALVTAASVLVPKLEAPSGSLPVGDDPMVNLYTGLIGGIRTGKSQVTEWAAKALGIFSDSVGQSINPDHYVEVKAGSTEQLVKYLNSHSTVKNAGSVLITPDEWSHLMSKAKIDGASLPAFLTTSFYRRKQTITIGGGRKPMEVNLNLAMSFIGGIVEDEFESVFSAVTLGGLYDRFFFGRTPEGFSFKFRPYPKAITRFSDCQWKPAPIRFDGSVYEVGEQWSTEQPELGRVVEICSRIAGVCASIDGRQIATGKDMEVLKGLAQYQLILRSRFKPNAGEVPDAIFANAAVSWIERHAQQWVNITKLKTFTHAYEMKLGPNVAERSLSALARGGRIELWLTNFSGTNPLPPDYIGKRPNIGLVRRAQDNHH